MPMGGFGPQAAQAIAWGVGNFLGLYIKKKFGLGRSPLLSPGSLGQLAHPPRSVPFPARACATHEGLDEPVRRPFPQLDEP